MQVDVGLHRTGHLGPQGLRHRRNHLAALDAPCLIGSNIAFMEGDLAIGAYIDIDPPALALGGVFMFPSVKKFSGRDELDTRPQRMAGGAQQIDEHETT